MADKKFPWKGGYKTVAQVKAAKGNLNPYFGIGPVSRITGTERFSVRWVEDPEALGLVFMGDFNKVARDNDRPRMFDHNGWYIREEDKGFSGPSIELARGVVYMLRLPRRGKRSHLYYGGVADPMNSAADGSGPCMLDMRNTFADPCEAARHGDKIAEQYGEDECDYSRASNARSRYDDLGEEVKETRKEALALIREIKTACPSIKDLPAIRDALRDKLAGLRRDIRKARKQRAELFAEHHREKGWTDNDPPEVAAA
jgi:hypothetical protein